MGAGGDFPADLPADQDFAGSAPKGECNQERDYRVIRLSRLPPSTNRLFYNAPGIGRRKTPPYRQWLIDVGWELRMQRVAPLSGPVAIELTLPDAPGRLPDADNALKASIDLLVRHRVIEEDDRSIVRAVAVAWDKDARCVFVRVRPVTPNGLREPNVLARPKNVLRDAVGTDPQTSKQGSTS